MIKAGEKFPISGQEYTSDKVMDKTECTILIDTSASKAYMSKILLHQMQITPCASKVLFNNSKTTGKVMDNMSQYYL